MDDSLAHLLLKIEQCKICEPHLELGARPIVRVKSNSKVIIIGQAPGKKVHQTGIPWDDPSGDQLRSWLGVDQEVFYNASNFALIPMGFCYPGKAKTGDLPPRKECAPLWHGPLLEQLKEVELVLLVGQYAQNYYLKTKGKRSLTERVRHFNHFGPLFFPLPHPSPRNFIWQAKNPWFLEEVVKELKNRIKQLGLTETSV